MRHATALPASSCGTYDESSNDQKQLNDRYETMVEDCCMLLQRRSFDRDHGCSKQAER